LLKRFFAPVWVFNLGIVFSLSAGWVISRLGHPGVFPARQGFPCPLWTFISIQQTIAEKIWS